MRVFASDRHPTRGTGRTRDSLRDRHVHGEDRRNRTLDATNAWPEMTGGSYAPNPSAMVTASARSEDRPMQDRFRRSAATGLTLPGAYDFRLDYG